MCLLVYLGIIFSSRNYNMKSDLLLKGDFDYRIQVGMLTNEDNDEGYNDNYDTDTDKYIDDYNGSLYLSAKLACGLIDSI